MLVVKSRGVVVIEPRPEVRFYQPETRKVKIGLAHVPVQQYVMSGDEIRLQRAFLKK